MNKTNYNLETLRANGEKKRLEKMEKIDKLAKNVLVNYPKGFTVKEVAVDTKMLPNTVRLWVDELVKDGRVQKIGVEGKAFIFCLSDFLTDKQEEAAKEEVAKVEEAVKEEPQKVCAGREFKDPRSVTSVVAGDISWISSRSGNGLFFRYLILIVHSYKATCVNVFPEGHEAVNVNDPNFIYIGEDTETGENLYADLTNVCQRRFSAFGERCMRVTPEHLEAVKVRLARLFKIDIHPVGDQGTVQKLKSENEKLSESLKTAGEKYQKLSVDYANYREGVNNQFKSIIHEKKETDKLNDDLNARLKASVGAIDALTAENNDLKAKLTDLQETHQECVDSGVLETEDLDRNTDLYIAIATLRTEKELLEKQVGEYLAIIDRLLEKV